MSTNGHHIISKKILDVVYYDEKKAHALQNRLSELSATKLSTALNQLFNQFDFYEKTISLDTITLDIGTVSEKTLEDDIVEKTIEELEILLKEKVGESLPTTKEERKKGTEEERKLELLSWFLVHGTLPWWASGNIDLNKLIQELITKEPKKITNLLRQYAYSNSFLQRLVINFEDDTLLLLLKKLEPTEAIIIWNTIQNIRSVQEQRQLIKADHRHFRNKVWEFVSIYLLQDRGSIFNTKSFVASILKNMAAHFNRDYVSFLAQFYEAIRAMQGQLNLPNSLPEIIKEIYQTESSETSTSLTQPTKVQGIEQKQVKRIPRSSEQAENLKKQTVEISIFFYYLSNGSILPKHHWFTENNLNRLIKQMVSSPDLVYFLKRKGQLEAVRNRLLDKLNQKQTKEMIRNLEPTGAPVILTFANNLQQLKEKNRIKVNTTNANFEHLKWQFIFKALLVNRGSLFNLKSFIKSTLYHLAAHFNIAYTSFLASVLQSLEQYNSSQIAGDLPNALLELQQEKLSEQFMQEKQEIQERTNQLKQDWLLYVIEHMESPWWGKKHKLRLSSFETILLELATQQHQKIRSYLFQKLQRLPQRQFSLSQLTIEGKRQVLQLILPAQFENIKLYVEVLQQLQEKKPANIQSHQLNHDKWNTIITALIEDRGSYFNMKAFILRTLHQMAHHFNTNFEELFSDFIMLSKSVSTSQSTSFQKAIQELADEHRQQLLATIEKDEAEKQWHKVKGKQPEQLKKLFLLLYYLKHNIEWTFVRKRELHNWLEEYNTISPEALKTIITKVGLSPDQINRLFSQIDLKQQGLWLRTLTNSKSSFLSGYLSDLELLFTAFPAIPWSVLQSSVQAFSITYLLQQTSPDKDHYFQQLMKEILTPSGSSWQASEKKIEEALTQLQHKFISTLPLSFSKLKQTQKEEHRSSMREPISSSLSDNVVQKDKDKQATLTEPSTSPPVLEEKENTEEGVRVTNAGLVILWPFLTQYFTSLGLLEEETFKSEQEAVRAVHLLQYLVTSQENQPEYDLYLNKIICGLKTNRPIEKEIRLTKQEKELSKSLLQGVKSNWKTVADTSAEALQETFFQREGMLYHKHTTIELRIEKKTVDVLLDSLPWSYGTIHFPWMKKIIHVIWNNN